MTRVRAGRPFQEYVEEQLSNDEFANGYHALEPEFQVARQVIKLRLQQGLSQKELAARVGTAKPNISCLERGTTNPSLHLLQRVAEALGAENEIKFTSVEAGN